MDVLILGGTGAMGKPLVDILYKNKKDWNITVTSRSQRQNKGNISFLVGNARDNVFLKSILRRKWDAIVDFMNYNLDEFEDRLPFLLDSTSHYIWFSSSRVYAESKEPLTENSPRLLETSGDTEFLATNRYALRKARQEDLLINSQRRNYTIIRPYITYNDERLQLGILEKEQWLHRVLKGKPLVVSKEMLNHVTSLSFGGDVSEDIAEIIDKESVNGEILQIAGRDTIKWLDLLKLYTGIIKDITGIVPIVYASDSICAIEKLYEGGYNTIYDRNYDRMFDSSKIETILQRRSCVTPIREGITNCLVNFLNGERNFLKIDPKYEAYQDLLTDSRSSRADFSNDEDWIIYQNIRKLDISEIEGLANNLERII